MVTVYRAAVTKYWRCLIPAVMRFNKAEFDVVSCQRKRTRQKRYLLQTNFNGSSGLSRRTLPTNRANFFWRLCRKPALVLSHRWYEILWHFHGPRQLPQDNRFRLIWPEWGALWLFRTIQFQISICRFRDLEIETERQKDRWSNWEAVVSDYPHCLTSKHLDAADPPKKVW